MYTEEENNLRIDIHEQTNTKIDVYLMDGDKIVEYKIGLSVSGAKDFVINVTNRYVLEKETVVNVGTKPMVLDNYIRKL